MIADLHCHYPMHVMMDEPRQRVELMVKAGERPFGDKLRAVVLRVASALLSDRDLWSGERVNLEYLKRGNARVVLSVLHSPFSEIDLTRSYGAPPASSYFAQLEQQIEQVEAEVAGWGDATARFVRDFGALKAAIEDPGEPIALIHCLEGGVDLGDTVDEIKANVETLSGRGVAYVTLAHLFYRQVATNAPALPFLPDRIYNWVFRQPDGGGLTERGRAAVEAMAANRILVDLAHMRSDAIAETFEILEQYPDLPVINSHAGYRFGKQEYMLDAPTIERIARRGGVVGLILAQHQLKDGISRRDIERVAQETGELTDDEELAESLAVICLHIDRICEITGSHCHVAIGSDFDGFIKPTLAGLENMGDMAALEQALTTRYGDVAKLIAHRNAVCVLERLWAT